MIICDVLLRFICAWNLPGIGVDKLTLPDEPDLRQRKYPAIIHFNADIKVKFKMMVIAREQMLINLLHINQIFIRSIELTILVRCRYLITIFHPSNKSRKL